MGKFYGTIGYGVTQETAPHSGIWSADTITEREVFGDQIENKKRSEKSEGLNDNIVLSMQVSFLADPFALANFKDIRYVKFMGTAWKVTLVEVAYPRLVLTLGGCYNE